ncbi:unnamed protein product [Symbiodinium natans]|uniref:Uncharacterized protein n=1 Tax=Symbiodinium natans TaxID=878477 RepID=A0A812JR21_9DINO|nr:unnamed protein product [Symbiodinium natans]
MLWFPNSALQRPWRNGVARLQQLLKCSWFWNATQAEALANTVLLVVSKVVYPKSVLAFKHRAERKYRATRIPRKYRSTRIPLLQNPRNRQYRDDRSDRIRRLQSLATSIVVMECGARQALQSLAIVVTHARACSMQCVYGWEKIRMHATNMLTKAARCCEDPVW